MATDCKSPSCHAAILACLAKKVSKRTVWVVCLSVGIPLFGVGAGVWSETKNMKDKFISVREMEPHIKTMESNKAAVQRLPGDINKLQTDVNEVQKDIKEILRYMRDK